MDLFELVWNKEAERKTELAITIDINCADLLYLLFKALKLKYSVGYSMDFLPLALEFIVD